MPEAFEILEHTADIGFRAWGRSREEMFENAALALESIVLEMDDIQPRETYPIAAAGEDEESLLVNWLSEVLFYLDARRVAMRRFRIEEIASLQVSAQAWGEARDPEPDGPHDRRCERLNNGESSKGDSNEAAAAELPFDRGGADSCCDGKKQHHEHCEACRHAEAVEAGRFPGPRVVLGGVVINPGAPYPFTGADIQGTRDRNESERALLLAQALGASYVKMQFPARWSARLFVTSGFSHSYWVICGHGFISLESFLGPSARFVKSQNTTRV